MISLRLHRTYLFLLVTICINLQAQTPEIIWEHGFGGSNDDRAMDIIQSPDGGLLTIGYSNSIDGDIAFNHGFQDFLVIKTESDGTVEWQKTFGGSQYDHGFAACLSSDNGLILVGNSDSDDGDAPSNNGAIDFLVVKLNADGSIIWSKNYGGTISETAHSIIACSDGNYLIVGKSSSSDIDVESNNGVIDYWALKINDSGDIIWSKSFGSSATDIPYDVIETSDNAYVIAGYTNGYNGDVTANYGNADYWVVKISNEGEIIWENSFGGSDTDIANAIVDNHSTGYFVFGVSLSNDGLISDSKGQSDFWLVSIDYSGNLIWEKSYGGTQADEGADITKLNSNEYILCGLSQSDNIDVTENKGNSDYWIVAIDSLGNLKWEKSIGGSDSDIPYSIAKVDSVTFALAGMSNSIDYDVTSTYLYYNFWLVKMGECNNVYFADTDGDGFGNVTSDTIACNIPLGYVTDSTDCDDANPAIHPTLTDICNAIDDNCNGITDEDATFVTYYLDNDGDLFGDILFDSTSCNVLVGYVVNSEDCNDLNAEINPLINETCNGIDDNCNIEIDEGLTIYTLYADADGDSFGNPDAAVDTCIETIIGYVNNSLDCDDSLATIYPGATELCNYLDDDCDGLADENLTYILSYQDNDGDNFGNPLNDSLSCELPVGYVVDNTDCDDTNAAIYPGAEEVLNGLDDDCDQIADEGLAITDIVKNTISIYPNPVNAVLYIQSNESQKITIINQLGETILFTNLLIGLNTISVADFASGVYWVKAENGKMVVWVKQ